MEAFKIRFPAGYVVDDILNDNLDMQVILEDGRVFYASAITVENVRYLMDKNEKDYYWCEDMFVVRDLRKETIRSAVERSREDGYFKFIFCELGSVKEIYGEEWSFDKVVDMTLE